MLHERLQSYLERAYPSRKDVIVSSIETLTAGWETDIFFFSCSYEDDNGHHLDDLVLRRYPKQASSSAVHEFSVLRELDGLGYPVPKVYLKETDSTILDGPFIIMDRIIGRNMGELLDGASNAERQYLIKQFGELFVRLHRFETKNLSEALLARRLSINTLFDNVKNQISHYGLLYLLPVLDWLRSKSAGMKQISLSITHMDFHPYNIMIDQKGQVYVIDWTASRVIDYRFDLGWTLLLVYAFSDREYRDAVLISYEEANDAEVEDIEFFEVAAALRRLLDVSVSLTSSATERGMRESAVDVIRGSIYHMRNVHNRLTELAGIRIAEVDKMIDDNS